MKLHTTIVLLCVICIGITAAHPFWGSSKKTSSKDSSSNTHSTSSSHGYPKSSSGLSGSGKSSSAVSKHTHGTSSSSHTVKPSYSRATSRPSYSRATPKPSYSRATSKPSYSRATPKPSYSRPTPKPSYSKPTSKPWFSRATPRPSYSRPTPKPSAPSHTYPTSNGHSGTSSSHFIHGESVIKPSQSKPSYAPSAPKLETPSNSGIHTYPSVTVKPSHSHQSFTPSSNIGHSYPSGGGLSGNSKYPSGNFATSVTVKPSHSMPSYAPSAPTIHTPSNSGNHMYPTNSFQHTPVVSVTVKPSHSYPSNGGSLSGSQHGGVHSYPNNPTHSYPVSFGISGTNHATTKRPSHSHSDFINSQKVTNTHNHPSQKIPSNSYPKQTYHQPPVVNVHIPPVYHQPFNGNTIGVQPIYYPTVTHVHHNTGPTYEDILAEILIARAIKERRERLYERYHRDHYHHSPTTVTHTHSSYTSQTGNEKIPNKPKVKPDVLTDCTMSVSTKNGTNVIELPCEIASTFIIKNTTIVPNMNTQTNCTIGMIRNKVFESTNIQCDSIHELAPVTELPPLKLNCIQQPFNVTSPMTYTPCTHVNKNEKLFPLKVIPLPKVNIEILNNGTSQNVTELPLTVLIASPIIGNSSERPTNATVAPMPPAEITPSVPPMIYDNPAALPIAPAKPNIYVEDTPINPPQTVSDKPVSAAAAA